MKGFYVLLLLLATASFSQNRKLVIIGSSTSACTGPSSFANCYVAKLDAYYDAQQPTDVVQLAVGGYNVYHGMPSWFVPPPGYTVDHSRNITAALALNPDVVLVNYPSNAFDVLTVDSIMKAFRTIRAEGIAQGVPVYITTTQPRTQFNAAARAKLKEIRDSIMLQFGYFAVNFWDGLADPTTYEILPAYNSGDNIHLNDAGHQILFERVRDKNIFAVGLPVKLTAFIVKSHQRHVSVTWSVADETAGTKYEVQRSRQLTSWETIHTTNVANPVAARNYQATDQNAPEGMSYYRLKVTDNGSAFYSAVVKVSAGKHGIAVKSFSTDVLRRQLIVKLDAPDNMRIQFNFINSAGIIVRRNLHVLQTGDNQFAFPLNSLPAGTYWAQGLAEGRQVFTKGFKVL